MATNGRRIALRQQGARELVSDLSRQGSTLIRQEVELAKAEMVEKGKAAGPAAAMLAGSAIGSLLTLGSLTALLIILLALVLPTWTAALLVTLGWAGVALLLAFLGRQRAEEIGTPMPEKTVETVKEDMQWLRNRK
jgi:Putative Actinobacterial Holin-X, holin superfamily III